jgi:hypothetical protein
LTDLDGLPTPRRCRLIAAADGYGPDWVEIYGRSSSVPSSRWNNGVDRTLKLAADDAPIRGRLLDEAGKPLEGVRVRVVRLIIPRDRNLDAMFEHVANSSDTTFLYSCIVHARDLSRPQLPGTITDTRTDADGRFTLSGIGRDRVVVLTVSSPTVLRTELTAVTRDMPELRLQYRQALPGAVEVFQGATFTRTLKPATGMIQGIVRDRDTHEPLAGMWVTTEGDPLVDFRAADDAVVTDEKGRFTIGGVDAEALNSKGASYKYYAFPMAGAQHVAGVGTVDRDARVVIDCPRGIPFRLKLVDEREMPVKADVKYAPVKPNSQIGEYMKAIAGRNYLFINRAAQRDDGSYESFVLPGPGAVLVETPGNQYRPAHVDPKAFFAPGRTNWTRLERITHFGNDSTVAIDQGQAEQYRYSAILLVNPAPTSEPLELSATVFKDKPRVVSLVDADGKPVTGVTAYSNFYPWRGDTRLRAATFPLVGLDPDRSRRFTFLRADGGLIGSLIARGDGDAPYTVRMERWATLKGRMLDEAGVPFASGGGLAISLEPSVLGLEINIDLKVGQFARIKVEPNGRFQIDQLVPGQRYSAHASRDMKMMGAVFEDVVLKPGEVRDLGDIRMVLPRLVAGK